MNVGNLQVSMTFLEDALHLPFGHKIKTIVAGINPLDAVGIIIEGPTLPELNRGDLIPIVVLEFEKISANFKKYHSDSSWLDKRDDIYNYL